jgi:hypothetical protein
VNDDWRRKRMSVTCHNLPARRLTSPSSDHPLEPTIAPPVPRTGQRERQPERPMSNTLRSDVAARAVLPPGIYEAPFFGRICYFRVLEDGSIVQGRAAPVFEGETADDIIVGLADAFDARASRRPPLALASLPDDRPADRPDPSAAQGRSAEAPSGACRSWTPPRVLQLL